MPRGVKGSGPAKAPKKSPAVAQAKVAPPPAIEPVAVPRQHEKPLGSVHIDSLSGAELKAYARRAGVLPRDVENLTEDRLRQNTKLVIENHFELLSEG